MTKLKLSKRLSLIASFVDKESILADIGCDHALLDIYLTNNNIVKKSVACDITKGAIDNAKKNIKLYNAKNIDVRLGDGLNVINSDDNIDTLVISGMGNQTIANILKENINKLDNINTIIIQSNTGYDKVRNDIINLGYYISDEVLVKENKIIYEIMKFKKGHKKYSKKEITFGPILLKNKNELFKEIITSQINKNSTIIKKLPKKKFIKKIKLIIENIKLKKEIH